MPEEIFFLSLVSVICGTGLLVGLIRTIAGHQKAKLEALRGGKEPSMTTGELQRLIHAAVEDATQPLLRKLESLEAAMDEANALPAARERRLLDAPAPSEAGDEAAPVRSRTRA